LIELYQGVFPLSDKFLSKHKPLIHEFLRYVLVGGAAFIVDFGILYFSKAFLFSTLGETGILLATALGFIAGLVFNYVLSLAFVFKQTSGTAKQNKVRSFVLFTIIGIIGLLITEVCMFSGIVIFGQQWYPAMKIIAAWIVLMWNYIARKTFIFKGAKDE
jgi:putative flippase GtrA